MLALVWTFEIHLMFGMLNVVARPSPTTSGGGLWIDFDVLSNGAFIRSSYVKDLVDWNSTCLFFELPLTLHVLRLTGLVFDHRARVGSQKSSFACEI